MKVVLSITKCLMAAHLLWFLSACSEKDSMGPEAAGSFGPAFRASLVSSVTGRPLPGVRVRVLLVQGGKYVSPTDEKRVTLSNDQGEFTVAALQAANDLMPLELFKERVVRTDTIVISFIGKPVKNAYRWFPGNEGSVCISMDPYLSGEMSTEIVAGE